MAFVQIEEKDFLLAENRDKFIQNSFREDTTSNLAGYQHGIICNNPTIQSIRHRIFRSSAISLLNTTFIAETIHESFSIPQFEYDILKENVDLQTLSNFVDIMKTISPFFGRAWALFYLQTILLKCLHYGNITYAYCFATPHMLLDYYNAIKETNTYTFPAAIEARILNSVFLSHISEDIPEDKLLFKFHTLKNHPNEIANLDYLDMVFDIFENANESFWLESGVSVNGQLIKDFILDKVVLMTHCDSNGFPVAKSISFDSFLSQKKGAINIDALYLLSKVTRTFNYSFNDIMKKLRIGVL